MRNGERRYQSSLDSKFILVDGYHLPGVGGTIYDIVGVVSGGCGLLVL